MFSLTKRQKKGIKELAEKYGLNFLTLFGSQAEKKTHKKSDVDLAYSAKNELDYKKEYELLCELQGILRTKTRIDLVDTKNAPPLLLNRIAFKGQLLAEVTPRSFTYFQMYAFKLFVEAKQLFNIRDQYILKNL